MKKAYIVLTDSYIMIKKTAKALQVDFNELEKNWESLGSGSLIKNP